MPFEFGSGATRRPSSFMSAAAQVPDPLAEVAYSGNLEADAAAELTAMEAAYRQRRGAEDKRFRTATDSEFWFAVCFRDRAAKDAFLAALKADRLGDKYLDGHALARVLGITLPD